MFVVDGGIETEEILPYQWGFGDKRRMPRRIDPPTDRRTRLHNYNSLTLGTGEIIWLRQGRIRRGE